MDRQKITSISDEDILHHFRKDDDMEWIGILFARYSHLLLGVCLKYLKNPEDAKDSVQQIFLKVLDELRRHQVKHFKAWVYQVTKNYCLMQLRHSGIKKQVPISERTEVEEPATEDILQKRRKESLLNYLEEALKQLPSEQQNCVSRFYLHKKSYQDIASETGYTLMQVKSYIQNGKRNLRILIDKMITPDQ